MADLIIDDTDKGNGSDDFSERLAEHFSEELTDKQLNEFERQHGELQTKDSQSRRDRFKKLVEEGGE
jgi:hypothetical protein